MKWSGHTVPQNLRKESVVYRMGKGSSARVVNRERWWGKFRRVIQREGLFAGLGLFVWQLWVQIAKRWISFQDSNQRYTYADWLRKGNGVHQKKSVILGEYLFSIILPVGKDEEKFIKQTIESLMRQGYDHWELWIVSCTALQCPDDPRIHQLIIEESIGELRIDKAVEVALQHAVGAYFLVMEPGDCLNEAMLEVVTALVQTNEPEMLYTDEDLLAREGTERCSPWFKPDFSPELLYSANLLHPVWIQTDTWIQAKAPYSIEKILSFAFQAKNVVHIPYVLYHAKSATRASIYPEEVRKALQCRIGRDVSLNYDVIGNPRYTWVGKGSKVSVVIPTRNQLCFLKRCLESLMKLTAYPDYEIILVDTGSDQQEVWEYYAELLMNPNVYVVRQAGVFNFSAACNRGVQQASGDLLLFLNNDVEILEADWLAEMARWAELPEIALVGAKLLYADRTIQHAGIIVGMEGHASHIFRGMSEAATGIFGSVNWYRNYLALTGACLMIRKEVFTELGGFDEECGLVFNDVELGVRAWKAGYRNLYTPFAQLIHHEGRSRGSYIPPQDIHWGAAKLLDMIEQGDPYYNLNLSTTVHYPTLRRQWEEDAVTRLEKIVRLKG